MLNAQSRPLALDNNIEGFNMISVVLLTQNASPPLCQSPDKVMRSLPREMSREIIVVHYKLPNTIDCTEDSELIRDTENRMVNIRTEGEFASAVRRGVEQSHGKFILVMDADQPYSEEVIPELVSELIQNPNSIVVASRFVEGARAQSTPFVHNALRKGARMIAKYGLKVKNVEDPMSTCFAFSHHLLKDINFEGKGKDALLELLVKVNNKNSNVPVKEIPIKQQGTATTGEVNFKRVLNYSRAVWDLYRYGKTSKHLNDRDIAEQKKHRSIIFLSKAGRFFTVGASGLIVNYAASFLLTTLIPNIWYIHATLFGIILSITSNFLLNKIWTFEDRDFSPKHLIRQYSLFMALCTLGAVIQLSLVYAFVEYSHIQYAVSLVMAVAIASLSNFLLNKKITFGERIWE